MATIPFSSVFKEFWKGEGAFKPKASSFTISAPWSNNGSADTEHFTWQRKPDTKEHLRLLYEDYASKHPFIPSVMNAKNPAKLMLEKKKWIEKCKKYCLVNEHKQFPEMLYKGQYGLEADKKPRQNAHLSSSWVKGLRILSPNRVALHLGGKWYTYDCNKSQQERLMQLQSIGHEINEAKKGTSSVLHSNGKYAP